MRTNDAGVKLIKKWEGLKTKAYQDVAGIWTIGYGHTSAAGGLKVTPGLVISEKEAEDILKSDLVKFENDVNKLVKVPLTDNQFATLVSFHFNTGALGKSTLLKKLNAGQYDAVPSELMKWNKATVNGKLVAVKGLTNRRTDEVHLWKKNVENPYLPKEYKDKLTQLPVEKVPVVEAPVTKEKLPNFWVSLLMLIFKEFRK